MTAGNRSYRTDENRATAGDLCPSCRGGVEMKSCPDCNRTGQVQNGEQPHIAISAKAEQAAFADEVYGKTKEFK